MLKKILIILGLVITIAAVSQTFDGDFGWHLRFGRDALAGAGFPYLDTYTYPYQGAAWVNHEWGGDVVFWWLYDHFGYFSLVVLVSLCVWSAFLMIQKHYFKRLTPLTIFLAIIFLLSIQFLLWMRLTLVAAFFFAWLIVSLEKVRFHKTYYSWPILFWLWSVIHGSWILGFIIINIYAVVAGLTIFARNRFGREVDWDKETFRRVYLWQFFSAVLITVNPYGFKIWSEVMSYFSAGYFKQYITEWLPSYSYPVFVWPLIAGAVALGLMLWGLRVKKISLPQFAVFIAVGASAWLYKRNNIYLVLLAMPVITYATVRIKNFFGERIKITSKIIPTIFWLVLALAGFCYFIPQIHISVDPWRDELILDRYGFPLRAVNYLANHTDGRTTYVFNEFWWGGYLNWRLPNFLVYLDGRGTATWRYESDKTALQSYREIKYSPGGLARLADHPIEYILLEKNRVTRNSSDYFNRLIFNQEELNKLFVQEPILLLQELRESSAWQLVYEDEISEVWRKSNSSESGN